MVEIQSSQPEPRGEVPKEQSEEEIRQEKKDQINLLLERLQLVEETEIEEQRPAMEAIMKNILVLFRDLYINDLSLIGSEERGSFVVSEDRVAEIKAMIMKITGIDGDRYKIAITSDKNGSAIQRLYGKSFIHMSVDDKKGEKICTLSMRIDNGLVYFNLFPVNRTQVASALRILEKNKIKELREEEISQIEYMGKNKKGNILLIRRQLTEDRTVKHVVYYGKENRLREMPVTEQREFGDTLMLQTEIGLIELENISTARINGEELDGYFL